jgi:uncharacterized membrane protein (UPF0127 family)
MIRNVTTGQIIATEVKRCETFFSRGRGLMFHRPLREDEALIFMGEKESVGLTSIHMFFVFFPIAVIWLDAEKRVVDKKLARPFRPYYASRRPAQHYLECHPSALEKVKIGDQVEFQGRDD